ncbi:MAG TPA: class I SAM-dependent methyltransferase [Paucimonas sp.]|nr:class I SAM-dependent methyltransferase [Paucimonas sp.]HJW54831.1 class I SAM-dependent methyltransferase [Burkholderiaceae bacterium]
MLLPNNPDLDPHEVEEKLRRIASERRRPQPLFSKPAVTAAFAGIEAAPAAGGLRAFVKRIPGIGPAAIAAYRLYRNIRMPGMSWRQRVRLIPVLGPLALWVNGIVRLNTVRDQIALDLEQVRQAQRASDAQAAARLDAVATRIDAADARIGSAVARLDLLDRLQIERRLHHLDMLDLAHRLQRLDALNLEHRLGGMGNALADLRAQDVARDNLIAGLKQELHRALRTAPTAALPPEGMTPPRDAVPATGFDEESFYIEFEGLFRGSREDIQQRLEVYLPYLAHVATQDGARVVDVGCGRGEWLELLAAQGIAATGIDMNSAMVEACRQRGFSAECADAIAWLRRQPPGSVAAVTGFHLIEHLPFETLIALFDAALHALQPDGLIIFETPNPENLQVGACNFYTDPTHLHPIPPPVAEFMARQRGFARADILRLHPYPDSHRLAEDSEAARRINQALYGPQDYAVLAWKTHAN